MKVVVLVTNFTGIKSNLASIKMADTLYILFSSYQAEQCIQAKDAAFFDYCHYLPEIETAAIIKQLTQYTRAINNPDIYFLTADEFCMDVVADCREYFHAHGPKHCDIDRFRNKDLMKQALQKSNILLPRYCVFDKAQYKIQRHRYLSELVATLPFPIFAKPIDGLGAVHTFLIHNHHELQQFADFAVTNAYEYELDEYLQGTLFHLDAINQNGRSIFFTASEYISPVFDFTRGKPCGSILLPVDHPLLPRLKAFNDEVMACMRPCDGATHLEVFLTPDQRMVFLEIAKRPVGSYAGIFIEKNIGFNYEEAHYRSMLGLPLDCSMANYPQRQAKQTWAVLPAPVGEIIALNTPKLQSEFYLDWRVSIGDVKTMIPDLSHPNTFAGLITLQNEDHMQLYQEFKGLVDYQAVTTIASFNSLKEVI